MVACRFIVIKKPFLSKSQNTFPGERGNLPKAGNHSPVKFLDLSSDFPGSHRGTTARLTGTLSPGLRPARIPPETHSPAHRNSFVPAPARPQSLPRPTAQRRRNHPGLTSTRPRLPTGEPPPGTLELTPPGPNPSRDPRPGTPEPSRLNFHPALARRPRPGSRFAFSPKGRPIRPNGTRGGEAESPPPREIMSIKGYKAVTFYHKSVAFARERKEFPAYFRRPRVISGISRAFLGFFRAIWGCFRPLPGDLGLFFSGKD